MAGGGKSGRSADGGHKQILPITKGTRGNLKGKKRRKKKKKRGDMSLERGVEERVKHLGGGYALA